MGELFRKEVQRARTPGLEGNVLLARPLPFVWAAWSMFVVIALAVTFLSISEYSRKERVRGVIEPVKGLIQVRTQGSGVVERVAVREGDLVAAGQTLMLTRSDSFVPGVGDMNQSIVAELERMQAGFEEQIDNERGRHVMQVEAITGRQALIERQLDSIGGQLATSDRRIVINQDLLAKLTSLGREGYASQLEIRRQEDVTLALSQQREELVTREIDLRHQRQAIADEYAALPGDHRDAVARLEAQKADTANQLVRVRGDHASELKASVSGRVSGIVARAGQHLAIAQVVMNIVPEDSSLHAVLHLPESAVGFVESGQQVRIRLDAFPYQRFGSQTARVVQVGDTLVYPEAAERPGNAGQTEPSYRAFAELTDASVRGYGRSFTVRPGMEFEADIITEKRSLVRWLFDPVFSIKGRFQ
ncbi:HlyD family secretion protein [Luteimonas sp. A501]